MNEFWYLLWDPLNRWQVYSELNVPDPGAFPDYAYRKYEVDQKEGIVFMRKLFPFRDNLNKKKIIPSRDNSSSIFPSLEEVISS